MNKDLNTSGPKHNTAASAPSDRERLAKRMAGAGLCSRRVAEEWIAEGRVRVNDELITTPATLVGPDDVIVVDGKRIAGPSPLRLFCFHKPVGLITSHRDEKGRATVFEGLPPELPRVISVGRLDVNSEGLLLLTTSGALARYMELPVTGMARTYRARVHGGVDPAKLESLQKGITIEGVRYGPIDAFLERSGQSNAWVRVTIHEGKNREVRKVLAHIGLMVNRLIRVGYGPFELGALPRGGITEIPLGKIKLKMPDFFKAARART